MAGLDGGGIGGESGFGLWSQADRERFDREDAKRQREQEERLLEEKARAERKQEDEPIVGIEAGPKRKRAEEPTVTPKPIPVVAPVPVARKAEEISVAVTKPFEEIAADLEKLKIPSTWKERFLETTPMLRRIAHLRAKGLPPREAIQAEALHHMIETQAEALKQERAKFQRMTAHSFTYQPGRLLRWILEKTGLNKYFFKSYLQQMPARAAALDQIRDQLTQVGADIAKIRDIPESMKGAFSHLVALRNALEHEVATRDQATEGQRVMLQGLEKLRRAMEAQEEEETETAFGLLVEAHECLTQLGQLGEGGKMNAAALRHFVTLEKAIEETVRHYPALLQLSSRSEKLYQDLQEASRNGTLLSLFKEDPLLMADRTARLLARLKTQVILSPRKGSPENLEKIANIQLIENAVRTQLSGIRISAIIQKMAPEIPHYARRGVAPPQINTVDPLQSLMDTFAPIEAAVQRQTDINPVQFKALIVLLQRLQQMKRHFPVQSEEVNVLQHRIFELMRTHEVNDATIRRICVTHAIPLPFPAFQPRKVVPEKIEDEALQGNYQRVDSHTAQFHAMMAQTEDLVASIRKAVAAGKHEEAVSGLIKLHQRLLELEQWCEDVGHPKVNVRKLRLQQEKALFEQISKMGWGMDPTISVQGLLAKAKSAPLSEQEVHNFSKMIDLLELRVIINNDRKARDFINDLEDKLLSQNSEAILSVRNPMIMTAYEKFALAEEYSYISQISSHVAEVNAWAGAGNVLVTKIRDDQGYVVPLFEERYGVAGTYVREPHTQLMEDQNVRADVQAAIEALNRKNEEEAIESLMRAQSRLVVLKNAGYPHPEQFKILKRLISDAVKKHPNLLKLSAEDKKLLGALKKVKNFEKFLKETPPQTAKEISRLLVRLKGQVFLSPNKQSYKTRDAFADIRMIEGLLEQLGTPPATQSLQDYMRAYGNTDFDASLDQVFRFMSVPDLAGGLAALPFKESFRGVLDALHRSDHTAASQALMATEDQYARLVQDLEGMRSDPNASRQQIKSAEKLINAFKKQQQAFLEEILDVAKSFMHKYARLVEPRTLDQRARHGKLTEGEVVAYATLLETFILRAALGENVPSRFTREMAPQNYDEIMKARKLFSPSHRLRQQIVADQGVAGELFGEAYGEKAVSVLALSLEDISTYGLTEQEMWSEAQSQLEEHRLTLQQEREKYRGIEFLRGTFKHDRMGWLNWIVTKTGVGRDILDIYVSDVAAQSEMIDEIREEIAKVNEEIDEIEEALEHSTKEPPEQFKKALEHLKALRVSLEKEISEKSVSAEAQKTMLHGFNDLRQCIELYHAGKNADALSYLVDAHTRLREMRSMREDSRFFAVRDQIKILEETLDEVVNEALEKYPTLLALSDSDEQLLASLERATTTGAGVRALFEKDPRATAERVSELSARLKAQVLLTSSSKALLHLHHIQIALTSEPVLTALSQAIFNSTEKNIEPAAALKKLLSMKDVLFEYFPEDQLSEIGKKGSCAFLVGLQQAKQHFPEHLREINECQEEVIDWMLSSGVDEQELREFCINNNIPLPEELASLQGGAKAFAAGLESPSYPASEGARFSVAFARIGQEIDQAIAARDFTASARGLIRFEQQCRDLEQFIKDMADNEVRNGTPRDVVEKRIADLRRQLERRTEERQPRLQRIATAFVDGSASRSLDMAALEEICGEPYAFNQRLEIMKKQVSQRQIDDALRKGNLIVVKAYERFFPSSQALSNLVDKYRCDVASHTLVRKIEDDQGEIAELFAEKYSEVDARDLTGIFRDVDGLLQEVEKINQFESETSAKSRLYDLRKNELQRKQQRRKEIQDSLPSLHRKLLEHRDKILRVHQLSGTIPVGLQRLDEMFLEKLPQEDRALLKKIDAQVQQLDKYSPAGEGEIKAKEAATVNEAIKVDYDASVAALQEALESPTTDLTDLGEKFNDYQTSEALLLKSGQAPPPEYLDLESRVEQRVEVLLNSMEGTFEQLHKNADQAEDFINQELLHKLAQMTPFLPHWKAFPSLEGRIRKIVVASCLQTCLPLPQALIRSHEKPLTPAEIDSIRTQVALEKYDRVDSLMAQAYCIMGSIDSLTEEAVQAAKAKNIHKAATAITRARLKLNQFEKWIVVVEKRLGDKELAEFRKHLKELKSDIQGQGKQFGIFALDWDQPFLPGEKEYRLKWDQPLQHEEEQYLVKKLQEATTRQDLFKIGILGGTAGENRPEAAQALAKMFDRLEANIIANDQVRENAAERRKQLADLYRIKRKMALLAPDLYVEVSAIRRGSFLAQAFDVRYHHQSILAFRVRTFKALWEGRDRSPEHTAARLLGARWEVEREDLTRGIPSQRTYVLSKDREAHIRLEMSREQSRIRKLESRLSQLEESEEEESKALVALGSELEASKARLVALQNELQPSVASPEERFLAQELQIVPHTDLAPTHLGVGDDVVREYRNEQARINSKAPELQAALTLNPREIDVFQNVLQASRTGMTTREKNWSKRTLPQHLAIVKKVGFGLLYNAGSFVIDPATKKPYDPQELMRYLFEDLPKNEDVFAKILADPEVGELMRRLIQEQPEAALQFKPDLSDDQLEDLALVVSAASTPATLQQASNILKAMENYDVVVQDKFRAYLRPIEALSKMPYITVESLVNQTIDDTLPLNVGLHNQYAAAAGHLISEIRNIESQIVKAKKLNQDTAELEAILVQVKDKLISFVEALDPIHDTMKAFPEYRSAMVELVSRYSSHMSRDFREIDRLTAENIRLNEDWGTDVRDELGDVNVARGELSQIYLLQQENVHLLKERDELLPILEGVLDGSIDERSELPQIKQIRDELRTEVDVSAVQRKIDIVDKRIKHFSDEFGVTEEELIGVNYAGFLNEDEITTISNLLKNDDRSEAENAALKQIIELLADKYGISENRVVYESQQDNILFVRTLLEQRAELRRQLQPQVQVVSLQQIQIELQKKLQELDAQIEANAFRMEQSSPYRVNAIVVVDRFIDDNDVLIDAFSEIHLAHLEGDSRQEAVLIRQLMSQKGRHAEIAALLDALALQTFPYSGSSEEAAAFNFEMFRVLADVVGLLPKEDRDQIDALRQNELLETVRQGRLVPQPTVVARPNIEPAGSVHYYQMQIEANASNPNRLLGLVRDMQKRSNWPELYKALGPMLDEHLIGPDVISSSGEVIDEVRLLELAQAGYLPYTIGQVHNSKARMNALLTVMFNLHEGIQLQGTHEMQLGDKVEAIQKVLSFVQSTYPDEFAVLPTVIKDAMDEGVGKVDKEYSDLYKGWKSFVESYHLADSQRIFGPTIPDQMHQKMNVELQQLQALSGEQRKAALRVLLSDLRLMKVNSPDHWQEFVRSKLTPDELQLFVLQGEDLEVNAAQETIFEQEVNCADMLLWLAVRESDSIFAEVLSEDLARNSRVTATVISELRPLLEDRQTILRARVQKEQAILPQMTRSGAEKLVAIQTNLERTENRLKITSQFAPRKILDTWIKGATGMVGMAVGGFGAKLNSEIEDMAKMARLLPDSEKYLRELDKLRPQIQELMEEDARGKREVEAKAKVREAISVEPAPQEVSFADAFAQLQKQPSSQEALGRVMQAFMRFDKTSAEYAAAATLLSDFIKTRGVHDALPRLSSAFNERDTIEDVRGGIQNLKLHVLFNKDLTDAQRLQYSTYIALWESRVAEESREKLKADFDPNITALYDQAISPFAIAINLNAWNQRAESLMTNQKAARSENIVLMRKFMREANHLNAALQQRRKEVDALKENPDEKVQTIIQSFEAFSKNLEALSKEADGNLRDLEARLESFEKLLTGDLSEILEALQKLEEEDPNGVVFNNAVQLFSDKMNNLNKWRVDSGEISRFRLRLNPPLSAERLTNLAALIKNMQLQVLYNRSSRCNRMELMNNLNQLLEKYGENLQGHLDPKLSEFYKKALTSDIPERRAIYIGSLMEAWDEKIELINRYDQQKIYGNIEALRSLVDEVTAVYEEAPKMAKIFEELQILQGKIPQFHPAEGLQSSITEAMKIDQKGELFRHFKESFEQTLKEMEAQQKAGKTFADQFKELVGRSAQAAALVKTILPPTAVATEIMDKGRLLGYQVKLGRSEQPNEFFMRVITEGDKTILRFEQSRTSSRSVEITTGLPEGVLYEIEFGKITRPTEQFDNPEMIMRFVPHANEKAQRFSSEKRVNVADFLRMFRAR